MSCRGRDCRIIKFRPVPHATGALLAGPMSVPRYLPTSSLEQACPAADYLRYVLCDKYTVDNTLYILISGLSRRGRCRPGGKGNNQL
jgi:hypothetical protein